MNNKFQKYKDDVISHIIKNLIWAPIAALIPMVYALLEDIKTYLSNPDNSFWTSTTIAIIISVLFLLLLLIFWIIYHPRNPSTFPSKELFPPEIVFTPNFRAKKWRQN